MAASAMIGRPMIGVQPPLTSGMAIPAAEKPPSTRAPSAPIKVRPMRAGMAKASPVRMSGAERCSVFWMEKDDPNPPVQIRLKKVIGDLPSSIRKIEKSPADATSAPTGMIKASIMRIVRGLKPLRSIEGEATMAVIVRLRRRVSRPLCCSCPNPFVAHVKPGDAMGDGRSPPPLRSGCGTLDAFQQIAHAVEDRIIIVHRAFDDDLAGVVLQCADIDRLLGLQPLDRCVGGLDGFGRRARAIG